MRVAIMQPYIFPYIGYFQLINAVDNFVIYDRIQYTKKGWINRNRILRNGEPYTFSIPIQKASDFLDIRERNISNAFEPKKLQNQIVEAYRKAPQFDQVLPLIVEILDFKNDNLFDFLRFGLKQTCDYLQIDTPILTSSNVEKPTDLRSQDRVLDICGRMDASTYINPIGGLELYQNDAFDSKGIDLKFLQTKNIEYEQFGKPFQSSLSIIDVMMFNPIDQIQEILFHGYELFDSKEVENV